MEYSQMSKRQMNRYVSIEGLLVLVVCEYISAQG